MTAILFRMPAGIPGALTRENQATVEVGQYNSNAAFPGYGLPGKISSGKFVPIGASDVAASVAGFLVRPFPTQSAPAITDNLGAATPPTSGICDVLKRGYISAILGGSTASAKGGTVYVRTANASTGKVVGDIEAAADVTVAGGVITGTGTGTIAASVTASAIPGTWKLTLQTTSNTSLVTVIDPNGLRHPDATVGAAYTSGGLTFTITAGGTMTAGDSFSPVVTANTFALPSNTYFMGAADASGNVEIAFNI